MVMFCVHFYEDFCRNSTYLAIGRVEIHYEIADR